MHMISKETGKKDDVFAKIFANKGQTWDGQHKYLIFQNQKNLATNRKHEQKYNPEYYIRDTTLT